MNEIIVTCELSKNKIGAFYLDYNDSRGVWEGIDIAGLTGTKFDRIELIDMDGDGDLDILTCEESEGLGVFWFENPLVR